MSDGLAVPHRVRHRRRARGHLQRLRFRRVLPPTRRAGGLRAASRPRGSDEGSAQDVGERRTRSGRRRVRRGGRVHRRFAVNGDGSITAVGTEMRSYYGRPILKEPVWQPEIPLYFFFGGLAGASGVLHGLARLAGNQPLARTSLYVGATADALSPALLISDLGRPER